MKPRLILVVTALLILPTAILSLLAARAVRMREESLERTLVNSANQTLRTVHSSLLAELRRTHERTVESLAVASTEYTGQSTPSQSTMNLLSAELDARTSSPGVAGFYAVRLPGLLIYPPGIRELGHFEQPSAADFFALDAADTLRFAGNDAEGALQNYLDIATDPHSPDPLRAAALIGAAQCQIELGRPLAAVGALQKITGGAASLLAAPLEARDSEGFLYALTALRLIVDMRSALPPSIDDAVTASDQAGPDWRKISNTAEKDLLEAFVLRYDRVVPLQKELLNSFFSTGDDAQPAHRGRLLALLHERQRHEHFAANVRPALQQEIERVLRDGLPTGMSFLVIGADVYSFGPIVPDEQVYGGFRIDMSGLEEQLALIALRAAEGKDVVVRVVPEISGYGEKNYLDSVRDAETLRVQDDSPIASLRLPYPFEHILLLARPAQTGMGQGADLRIRLQVWGVLVLALGILIGTWIVLRYAAGEVQRAKARGDLIAGVSHDLRTPLASMRMLADSLYLGRVTDPSRQKQFLSTIVRESSRLGTLVDRILFFVRLGEEALTYQFRPTQVDAVAAEAIESVQGTSGPDSTPDIKLEVEPDLPTTQADSEALRQVVLNLVDNAVKYSKPMGSDAGNDKTVLATERSHVTIKVRRHGDSAIAISVADNGIGIPRNELKKIFRRFYRVSGKQRDTVSGVGMGLALCRHIVAAHDGRIDVVSELGKGSTFTVILPVRE